MTLDLACFYCELGKTARLRSFMPVVALFASRVMRWTVPGAVCRAVAMASAGRRAWLYRLAHPLPLGAGEYVRSAGVGSVCGEGAGCY